MQRIHLLPCPLYRTRIEAQVQAGHEQGGLLALRCQRRQVGGGEALLQGAAGAAKPRPVSQGMRMGVGDDCGPGDEAATGRIKGIPTAAWVPHMNKAL